MKNKGESDASTSKALADKEKRMIEHQRLMQEEMRKKEQMLRDHEENRSALEELKKELTHAIQQINEANERALLLGKNVLYKPELYQDGTAISKSFKNTRVRINVEYPELSEDFKIY